MEKLDLRLPEFMRTIWVSEEARRVWEPRFYQISRAWEQIERISVVTGVRDAALQVIPPEHLTEISEWAIRNDLVLLPLSRQGASGAAYQSGTTGFIEGQPWTYRVVITKQERLREFMEAWPADNDTIGRMLGFPPCCREFFEWSWVKQGWRDVALTPLLGEKLASTLEFPCTLSIKETGYPENNLFLRHLGLRLVFHLPCSHNCSQSQVIARWIEKTAIKSGFLAEMAWLREILRWPLKWSSLHGVAILTTPVVKVVYNSDAFSEQVEILREGDCYPVGGGKGEFPFQGTVHALNTSKNNGFQSQESMLHAHAMILQGIMSLSFPDQAKVIDLGCGDGQLLDSIASVTNILPVGVELDRREVAKATKRFAKRPHQLFTKDIFDVASWNNQYFLGLISLNRFAEAGADGAKELLRVLKVNCEHVLFYSYDSKEWPGYPGLTNDFVVEKFMTGPNSCAALMRPLTVKESV